MKIKRLSITNVLGVEHVEINEPGPLITVTGENGTGKTSVLESIKTCLGTGHDATLLRAGAEQGQIVLILDDGVEIATTITPDGTKRNVLHPEYGKLPKSAAYLKKLVDALSLNPVQFLTASKKDRVDQLLAAIPMQVTADQLSFIPDMALAGVDLSKHALEVIGQIGKSIYDLRTGVNRAEKEKRATAKQMSETLPPEAPEGTDWEGNLEAALDEERKLTASTTAIINRLRESYSKDTTEAKAARDKRKAELVAERDRDIEKLRLDFEAACEKIRNDTDIAIGVCSADCDESTAEAKAAHDKAMADAQAEYSPKAQAIKERIAQAKAMVEQHAKAQKTREFIRQMTTEADQLDAESSKLTHAMGQLEGLKASLLERLPIEGLSVQDGDIFVGGIPFDRVNTSRRIRIAIEVAKLKAGNLPLIACDGLEALDSKTFEIFKKEAERSKCQFIISRVTEGPLSVKTEVA